MPSDNLFRTSASVVSSRILYTPSLFARSSLLYLQEIGSLEAVRPHTSSRSNLASYLFFIVESGAGNLLYHQKTYELRQGDCVFIDCRASYAHSVGENLWSLKWCHFFGAGMRSIYAKYQERGGQPVFHSENSESFVERWQWLYAVADSSDHIRDMKINEGLSALLTLIMQESWHPERQSGGRRSQSCLEVKAYLEEHFTEKITLDRLAAMVYLDKFYLTRCFKEEYGVTINQYLTQLRITKAKQLLRFTEEKLETIGLACGIGEAAYFSRLFRKIEGMSPSEYREKW